MIRSRFRQLRRVLQADGVAGVRRRLVRVAHRMLGEAGEPFPLHPDDVADAAQLVPAAPPVVTGRPLRIAWITTPPGAGSGGHTTMLRMVEGLEQAGHSTALVLYDVFRGDRVAHEAVIRQHWPRVRAEVRDAAEGFGVADVWIATSWQTAHVLASRPHLTGHRMYFVQDYEPWFYPHGALYALAEETYRFGFTGITAGAWLAGLLSDRFGMHCSHFEFGADTDVYSVRNLDDRDGVVFYSKPGVARRGHELGVLALQRFASMHPEARIHFFGDSPGDLPFDAVDHGRITPRELDELYNRCRVGLSLSFSNVSLIPWELLASGVRPVVNDADHNRIVLRNEHVAWAQPTPGALARALDSAWRSWRAPTTPQSLSESVAEQTWRDPSRAVTEFIERSIFA
ncbi:glycosyltransferase family 1 protein [Ruicaihuangia caeni]|uniref:Glycosyltransferase family 1 protein n=1 Tax=Ruicaihuangia caeni TaxID=3042517 RepID=A0AAW6T4P1_9MICO|nr:glycosyltransferase family 1 protein [Klugiella sp. YN-L-19]MDI2097601.1 glycosyltransferase family 1 protein [Klugiella sp. YN-L-19]